MVKIRIPTPLQKFIENKKEIYLEGKTVRDILEKLTEDYPSLKERIYDEDGNLRKFINIYVNDEDIRFLKGEDTEIKDGDTISIIPAIAGGEK